MNRCLAQAILGVFQEGDRDSYYASISEFKLRDWERSYGWLDASGLALYFIDKIKNLQIEDAIPTEVLMRLEQNLADNRERTADLFGEFIRINELFKGAGISYVNLKGFTLIPGISSDAALRRQFDLDFAVSNHDVLHCESILKRQGYWLTGIGKNVLEFKAGSGKLPSLQDLYKVSPQRSLEIHFSDASNYEALIARTKFKKFKGSEVPVLQESDIFLALASHLFKHLQGEWTRVSWILEYASYVRFHIKNGPLWSDVLHKIKDDKKILNAVGASTLLAYKAFALYPLPEALSSAIDELPVFVHLWIERYTEKILFSEFPGSKLYLLLKANIESRVDGHNEDANTKKSIFYLPPRVSYPVAGENVSEKIKRWVSEIRYLCLRIRFHAGEGVRYVLEVQRWKRYLASRSL